MIPLPKNCPYCNSPQWEGDRYKFFSCGKKRNSLFQRRTDECKRRESEKLVREALVEVFKRDKEQIKRMLQSLAAELLREAQPKSETNVPV